MNNITLIKKVSPSVFGIIVICFFMPFVNISCAGENIITLTGFQLITGTSIDQSDPFGRGQSEKVPPEPLGIAVFVCGILGLLLSFLEN
ncbi:hypothetical protein GF312_01095 [Candidatus Poribacteria bacterium]|nr:hypothetical protein [Candidatus Poribacteria bacterium]